MTKPTRLLILGASARAAAQSAIRAGFEPLAADLFADQDLMEICPGLAVDDYPDGLLAAALLAPAADWLYTGGLENHPQLVDKICADRRLLGNAGDVLRRVRDPFAVAAALARHGIACPAVADSPAGLPVDGTWLRKPRRSSGGQGIEPWTGNAVELKPSDRGWRHSYFQARAPGTPCSAVFVAAGRAATLLGVTEQLIGAAWAGAGQFSYSGSLGPVPLSVDKKHQWQSIGQALAEEFDLVGLFGVDAVDDGGVIRPIEVNPRYTASIEVLERVLGLRSLDLHAAACRNAELPAELPAALPIIADTWCGKVVVYAAADCPVDAELAAAFQSQRGDPQRPSLADIPRIGTVIRGGWPAATVLAEGGSREAILTQLQARAADFRRILTALGGSTHR